ncbi:hypothetical protein LTR85_005756 [Meristemomyces frigidus]|nr:hypothetical protein LTR85_005756 [Meristemomyces frigidus]
MSADQDGDSRMASSPSPSDDGDATIAPSPILSPPDSQHHDSQHLSTTSMPAATTSANANGKRPIQTISNGTEEDDDVIVMGGGPATANGGGKARQQDNPAKTHAASGYTWARAEDEPGYAWGNKKASDEMYRAWDREVVHKDCMIKGRYGDPFEAAEKEQAVLNSLKQR